jgi:hypothetical protein
MLAVLVTTKIYTAICSRVYAGINCRPNYSASGWKSRRAIILCVEGGVSFRWGATLSQL